jgi:site-specific DNA-cytosine methylase
VKVLVINTYGGSLLCAAKLARMDVRASLEDCGFGSDLQALNFPKVPICSTTDQWPRLKRIEAKETIAIAHPPCASFSLQSRFAAHRQGTDTDGFRCHIRVMDYALGNKVKALAIESVPGALAAVPVYEEYAKKYGYKVGFIMQNAVSFGVPQWRPRMWSIFCGGRQKFTVDFKPTYKLLREVADCNCDDVPPIFARLKQFTDAVLEKAGKPIDELRGGLFKVSGIDNRQEWYRRMRAMTGDKQYWDSLMPRFLEPYGFASTVMKDSTWYMNGKQLCVHDYNRIAGFPRDYQWGSRKNSFRMYLSKGVAPPVAAWIIQQLKTNALGNNRGRHALLPGEVLDLNPKKAEALKIAREGKL